MEDIKPFWEELTGGEVAISQIEETLTDMDKDSGGNIDYKGFLIMMN